MTCSENLVKYVDDSITWEVLGRKSVSSFPLNVKCPSLPPVMSGGKTLEIVKEAKLLRVLISDDLKWKSNIDSICEKASKRLPFAFSKQIRFQLTLFVRFIAHAFDQYWSTLACEVWHSSLSIYLCDKLLCAIAAVYFVKE